MDYAPKILIFLALLATTGSDAPRRRWAVYYSDALPPAEFRGYDLVIFDSDRHPDLQQVSDQGSEVLGYLSLGEVEPNRAWFSEVKAAGMLAAENPNWPGSYYVDLRDARWRDIVVSRLVPGVLNQGFAGLFLDTLDDAVELERRNPAKFGGMKAAAVELVKEIRHAMPGRRLMVNRAYELLPQMAADIDVVLGESVYGTYDFASKTYRRVSEEDYRSQVELLTRLRLLKPTLRVCTLDYWNPADRDGVRQVYREERSNGFDPYVTTISLDQLTGEPQ